MVGFLFWPEICKNLRENIDTVLKAMSEVWFSLAKKRPISTVEPSYFYPMSPQMWENLQRNETAMEAKEVKFWRWHPYNCKYSWGRVIMILLCDASLSCYGPESLIKSVRRDEGAVHASESKLQWLKFGSTVLTHRLLSTLHQLHGLECDSQQITSGRGDDSLVRNESSGNLYWRTRCDNRFHSNIII